MPTKKYDTNPDYTFDSLIEALQIARKYGNPIHHTFCEHNELYLMIDPADVSLADIKRLAELSFFMEGKCFGSFYFGYS